MEQREVILRYVEGFQKKKARSEEFASDFLHLKRQSAKYRKDHNYSTKAAERAENFKKNRYKDILPFDHSRVELSLITSDDDSDYINASFIKGVYCPRTYIATQGPLPSTLIDFWRMIWEYNMLVVVMACMEFEMGKKKCERYWAEVGAEVLQCGPFSITCSNEEKKTDYVIRTLKATYGTETRIVYQLHYKNWPDHDVPTYVEHILDLIRDMRLLQGDDSIPLCIHCSAGCGRTGVICAIDYIWKLLKDGIIPLNFSIFNLIQEMRTQRSSLVQTKEQYELVYNAVINLFKRELERIDGTSNSAETQVFACPSGTSATDSSLIRLPCGFTDKDRGPQEGCNNMMQENIFQCTMGSSSSTICHPVVKPSNRLDFLAFSNPHGACGISELSSPINQQPNTIRMGRNAALFKHQDHYSKNVNSDDWYPKPPAANRRSYSGHSPLIRTNSTPFEFLQQRGSNIPGQANEAPAMDTHMFVTSTVGTNLRQQGFPWQNLGTPITGSLGNITTLPISNAYIRLTEDPYFSPPPSSDLGSPKFDDFCVEATCPEQSKLEAGSEYILEMPPHSSLSALPCINQPSKQVTVFESEESHGLNCKKIAPDLDEEGPPPLPDRTPESFIVPSEATESPPIPSIILQPSTWSVKVGTSLEWSGVSQSQTDNSKFQRSKSVKVRSIRLEKPRDTSPSPPPLPERTKESFIVPDDVGAMQHCIPEATGTSAPMDTENSESTASPEPEKHMSRKKSLKILRNVKKNLCSSVKPSESSPSSHALSFLNFSFGNRFAKPKGPRNPPATWNL
ncbi:hypothetical protein FKM82_016788 [Ascaphus truei]